LKNDERSPKVEGAFVWIVLYSNKGAYLQRKHWRRNDQALFKTWNSIVLSLPKEVLEDLGINDGESVNLELDHEQHRVIITPVEKPAAMRNLHTRWMHLFSNTARPWMNWRSDAIFAPGASFILAQPVDYGNRWSAWCS
jgi:antitoxin component of MazEF toxin-antitoxin module